MEKKKNTKSLLSTLRSYCKREGYDYSNGRFPGELMVSGHRESMVLEHFVYVSEEEQLLSCRTYFPVLIPESRRGEVLELISRANNALDLGRLQFVYDHGVIFFETSSAIEHDNLPSEVIDGVVLENMMRVERCFMALLKVLFSKLPALKALASKDSGIGEAPNQVDGAGPGWVFGDGPDWAR